MTNQQKNNEEMNVRKLKIMNRSRSGRFNQAATLVGLWVLSLICFSCEDNYMDWEKDETKGTVTTAELPLEMEEILSRYDVLKNYLNERPAGFKFGVGVGMGLYMNKEIFRETANAHFQELTIGYAMKHGPMVGSDGMLDFEAVDAFMEERNKAGMTVFGHTLVWHSNQNASYLNGLIAPTIIPGSGGTNLLDLSVLDDGTFTDWRRNNSAGITVEAGKGIGDDAKAIQLISSATSSNPWDLQLTSPGLAIDSTHTYRLSFFIKSDGEGKGRISFSGLKDNYANRDWYNTGGDLTGTFETTPGWQQVGIDISNFADVTITISFDLGYEPDVTYYIDAGSITLVDKDDPTGAINLIANGSFETDLTGWSAINGSNPEHVSEGEGYDSDGAMKVVNPTDNDDEQWRTQMQSRFTDSLSTAKEYLVSYWIRSEDIGSVRCSTTGEARYQSDQSTGTDWKYIEWVLTSGREGGREGGLNFDLGLKAGTYYIDDVSVREVASNNGGGGIIIEMSDEEKEQLIGDAMEHWISEMVGRYKGEIHAWDVVNEPVLENGELRTGNVTDPPADHFYWVKYLGRGYAARAFKLARQYGNEDDILFINDYNLEYSLDKCDGLIAYVAEIEQEEGARVDGIGTQMHISANSDKDKIRRMFEKLAASGKLIKISELDVRLGTATPTLEQLMAQAEMYQYVLEQYFEIIPVAQQYGITIWGVSDNEDEHEFWLPEESPNLWDANFTRKPAYKGVADALAGKDISVDFTGELVD